MSDLPIPLQQNVTIQEIQDEIALKFPLFGRPSIEAVNQLLQQRPSEVRTIRCNRYHEHNPLWYQHNNNNYIKSLDYLPNSIEILGCSNNQLEILEHLPSSIKILHCNNNYIKSLNKLPNSVETISCNNNQIQSIENLPTSVKKIYCSNNSNNQIL
jgi:hypothetical protein